MKTSWIWIFCILLSIWILYYIYGGHYNPFKRCVLKAIASLGFVLFASLSFLYTNHSLQWWMFIGLFLGMIGDICLDLAKCYLRYKEAFFLGGLGSFLFGHLAYAYVFLNHFNMFIEIPLCILLAVLFVFILKRFGCVFKDKLIPVGVYGFVILLMLLQALKYLWYTPSFYSLVIVLAAILFTISDLILSFLLFQEKVHTPALTQANLTTYYTAQMLLSYSMFLL